MASADSHKGNDRCCEAQAFLAAPGTITAAITAAETQWADSDERGV